MKRLFVLSLMILLSDLIFAHCDTMDGPVIADARKAIEQNNVNYALKWVPSPNEAEIKDVFNLMMKVRGLSPDARELAERYFFETLVRIHRTAEGMAYTGIKPSGTPVDEKILAADKALETGNLSPLKVMVAREDIPELTERFNKAVALKNFDIDNVAAGREYIEAYVAFFKFAEGEEHLSGQGKEAHGSAHGHAH